MNRTRTGATVVATLSIAVGALAAGVSIGPASAHTASTAQTFKLRLHHGTDSTIDLGKPGFSAGDQDLMTGPITRGGHPDGHLVGSCTTVRVGAASVDQVCEFIVKLRHGQITAIGAVASTKSGPGTFPLAIIGGTGVYKRAAGQINVTSTNGGTVPVEVVLR